MEHLRCVVERITYQNAENGYTVLKCAAKNYNDLVTVVGTMPDTHVGSVLLLEGSWKVDARYGRQFSVEKFEEALPATVYGIEKYLGSGLIKGVGPKFARRIVQEFGKDTLDVIDENPDALIRVEGIGRVRVERIRAGRNRGRSRTSWSFCRAMQSAPPTPQRFSRPTGVTAFRWCRKIPTVWRMISGESDSGRRI